MYGWRGPLRRWVGAQPGAALARIPFAVPQPSLPVPYYAQAARLPIYAANDTAVMPWSALFVPADLDGPTLDLLCELLTKLNENYLRTTAGMATPDLYKTGIRYELMPQTEYWLVIPWALAFMRAGRGVDCKVLAAWRAAELRVRGGEQAARCVWTRHETRQEVVYHVRVQRADGTIEDPSARLGMTAIMPGSQPLAQVAGMLWRP
jgi:hypothetical protein